MPRELVTLQVGQCGNQVACRFWDLALREHEGGVFNDALSSFFKNVDCRRDPGRLLPVGDGSGPVRTLKARSVVIDMEEGVVNEMLRSSVGHLFDSRSMLLGVSGAGNNWAHGYHFYGAQYHDDIMDCIRCEAEACDSLQAFLLLHSIGGGTGSGLGTYLLSLLEDAYPEAFRFTVSLFPSEDDDVVTSPYNAMLALNELIQHASCVLPLENQALLDICGVIDAKTARSVARTGTAVNDMGTEKKPFHRMNSIAANMLLNLTAGMRFEGSLNVDANDIAMSMVPFPRMHFLIPSMTPLAASKDRAVLAGAHRELDHAFKELTSREHQMVKCDPRSGTYLACAMLLRGSVGVSDAARNIARLKQTMRMAHWNQEGFKLGLCSKPAIGVPSSLLCLSNSTCIAPTLASMRARFQRLYKRRVHVHHYSEYMDVESIASCSDACAELLPLYKQVERQSGPDRGFFEPTVAAFL